MASPCLFRANRLGTIEHPKTGKLKALQTQEQLGIQALQIANTSADTILQLFRN